MDLTAIPLFALADRRLTWLDQRQQVLAENIANIDTPGFSPRDLPDFASTLGQAAASGLARTDPRHLPGAAEDDLLSRAQPSGRAPDGNAVGLDAQLTKIADTQTAQALVTSVYKKYLDMFAMALGHGAAGS